MDLSKVLHTLENDIKRDVNQATKGTSESIKNAKMTSDLRKDLKLKQRLRPNKQKLSPTHKRGC